MRAFYIGLLLIVTLNHSCCNDEDTVHADEENNSFSKRSRIRIKDSEPYKLLHEKLSAALDNDQNCYERKEKSIPLKYREDLKADLRTLETEIPVDYVFVRASKENCTNENECVKLIQSLRKRAHHKGCEPVDNFYVGGDGYVYEGRGWDMAPYWELNGLRRNAITVQFCGDYMKNLPPPRVMEAFRSTLQIGVWLGKVSKSYKITSMRDLFNNNAHLGAKLDEELMTWGNWVNATFFSSLWEYAIPKCLTFVFRSQWNASEPQKELVPRTPPVGYIMISDGGDRCHNRSECTSWMKREQMMYREQYGDLLHNFYIGEEGEVYEGRGWDVAPHWEPSEIKSGLLSIKLVGSSELEPPSELAINSLKLLVHTGVQLGKISPGYLIFSLRQVYHEINLTGETLYRIAEGWVPRWRNGSSNSTNGVDRTQPSPFISTSDRRANFPAWGSPGITVPVDYVIVYDGNERCFTRHECTAWMKEEEEKYRSHYGNLLDNFYIGEDGSIYEGRGWRRFPQWSSLFPGISFITVKFMGNFEKEKPLWLALTAFNALLTTGIDSGTISRNHRLITLRQTYSTVSPPNSLESILKQMKPWSNKITMNVNGSTPLYRNLIFPLHRWVTTPLPDFPKLKHPIEYVVVGSVGQRCFTEAACMDEIKKQNSFNFKSASGNFYIGECGWTYEGRGWEGASQLNVRERDHNFLFVMFLGSFESALPSSIAMYGFRHLMQFGVSAGKLAPDYRIVSIRQIFRDAKNPRDMLSEDIKSWNRWSESVPYSSGEDHSPSGDSIYVSRGNWNAVDWTPPPKLYTIHHVFVRNVGKRCFKRDECTSVVRAEQNKSLTQIHSDRFIMENFYVGEDGHVYEGRGWDGPPSWMRASRVTTIMSVAFLGDFEKDLPSPKAVFAFKYLMKLGVYMGAIRSPYRLESVKTNCAGERVLGSALDQEIKSWENWRQSSLTSCLDDSIPTQ